MFKKVFGTTLLLTAYLAIVPSAYAVTCPVTNSTPAFTAGGSVFGRIAAQFNSYFGAKVDANNGVLCNPTIIGGTQPGAFTIGPGLTNQLGTRNTGNQTVSAGALVSQQLVPVTKSTSYFVNSDNGAISDSGSLLIATAAITWTLPQPQASTKGVSYHFGSDGVHVYTLNTAGMTALFYGCPGVGAGLTSSSFGVGFQVTVTDDGTNYNCSSNVAIGTVNGMPFAANNAALQSLSSTFSAHITRIDFSTGFGAPAMDFDSSSSPCTINSGAGDGGVQVPTTNSGCWNARQPAVISLAEWGLDPTSNTDVSAVINGLMTSLSNSVSIVTMPANAHYLFTNPVTNLPPVKFVFPYNSTWDFPGASACGEPNFAGNCVTAHGAIGSAQAIVTSGSDCSGSPVAASVASGAKTIYTCASGITAGTILRVFSDDPWAVNFKIGYLIHVATVTSPVGSGPYAINLAENFPFNLTNTATPQLQVVTPADGLSIQGLTLRGPAIGNGTVGPVSNLGTVTPGSGYTNGTYTSQALTGGHGTGAQATIIVAGGIVTSATITNFGSAYEVGDVLSAAIPGGSGFSVPVDMVGGDQIGLELAHLTNFSLDNVTITGFDLEAMDISRSWAGQIRNSQGNFSLGFGLGYGATISGGSRDIVFDRFTSNRTWDVIATGGTTDINRNVRISHSGGNGNIKTCFNNHESMIDFSVSDSWCIAAPDARPGNYSGVTLNGSGNITINNVSITMPINTTSTGTDAGILCQPTITYSYLTTCTISNSTVDASLNTKSVNFLGQNLTSNSGLSITMTGNHSIGGQTAFEIATVAGSGRILSPTLIGNDTPIAPALHDLLVTQATGGGEIDNLIEHGNSFTLNGSHEMIYLAADDTAGIVNATLGPDNLRGTTAGENYVRLFNVARAAVISGNWTGGSTTSPVVWTTSSDIHLNILTGGWPLASIGTCDDQIADSMWLVNDALTPAYATTLTGGSNSRAIGICDGSSWKAH